MDEGIEDVSQLHFLNEELTLKVASACLGWQRAVRSKPGPVWSQACCAVQQMGEAGTWASP